MKKLLPQEEATEYLLPYFEKFVSIIEKAMADVKRLEATHSEIREKYTSWSPLAKSVMVNNFMSIYAEEAFSSVPEVIINPLRNDPFGILLRGKLFIRFNKLNADLSPSTNNATKRTEDLNYQNSFEGFDNVPCIYAGYTSNREAIDSIGSINLVYRPFNSVIWNIDLRTRLGQEQPEIPFYTETGATVVPIAERRVTIKNKPQADKTIEG